jgi:hypothetical protein
MHVYITYTRPLSVQAEYNRLCPIISSFCYNSSLVTWTVVCLTAAKRTGLSFTIAAGPCQRSHFLLWVLWDLQWYFTVSDSRLPFSSSPTTRRVTVEVFDPTSTWDVTSALSTVTVYHLGTDHAQKTHWEHSIHGKCVCSPRNGLFTKSLSLRACVYRVVA